MTTAPGPDEDATAAPPAPDAGAPPPPVPLVEALRSFIGELCRTVRDSLVRSLAATASAALVMLVVLVTAIAMAATGAVLLIEGTAAAAAGWLGSVPAGHCLVGALGIAIPLAAAWWGYRVLRR